MIDVEETVYALRHLDNGTFICVLRDGVDYLICYSEPKAAFELRADLGQEEFCEICSVDLLHAGIREIWLDGVYMEIGSESTDETNDEVAQHRCSKP